MYKQIVKLAPVIAIVALSAAGMFYAKSSVQSVRPQADSGPMRPRNRRAAGRIEGRVIDIEGHLVAGAKVYADRSEMVKSLLIRGQTDDEGNFTIDVPEPGTYMVFGSKEEDGYPDTISAFHREVETQSPTVTVALNQVVQDVVLQFGPKASRIDGIITNAVTKQPITKATITLRRADNPEIYYIIGSAEPKEKGRFKVLVPSVPFTIEVTAPSYEKKIETLRLKRGVVKRLNIALHLARQAEREN